MLGETQSKGNNGLSLWRLSEAFLKEAQRTFKSRVNKAECEK